MKIQRFFVSFARSGRANLRHDGSALLIVLILLSMMGALVVSNGIVLHRLEVELRLLEQKQIRALAELEKEQEARSESSNTNEVR